MLITTKDTSNDANTSLLIDSMDPGDSYQRTSFNGISTETLTITFLSLSNDDVADISIVLSGSTVAKQSESPTIAPVTPAPTKEPSQIPTAQPTKSGTSALEGQVFLAVRSEWEMFSDIALYPKGFWFPF